MDLCRSLVCLLLVSCSTACSRGCSTTKQQPAPAASAAKPVSSQAPTRTAPSAAPAATPESPPQLVACNGLEFYRITDDSLHGFEASKRVPPAHLRGSATASASARSEVADPLGVIALDRERVLVIGKQNVFVYRHGEKQARPSGSIPTPAPLFSWPDRGNADGFAVHVHGEKQIHHYTLPNSPNDDAAAPAKKAELADRTEPLSDFDARLFTVLTGGVPLYTTARGLTRLEDGAGAASFSPLSPSATLLFADASPDRYWTAEASGAISLRNRENPSAPVFTSRVPGVVIDSAVEGDTVAVLSMELKGHSYQPTVTVFSKGEQVGQISIGPSSALYGQPKLDLCLLAGRPWVVVGGRQWLQLLDWKAPRLLAEW